jgi:plastocyanin
MRLARIASFTSATALFGAASMFGALPAQAADEVTITATLADGFSPDPVTVDTGTTVTWRNGEAIPPLTTGPTGQIAVRHHVRSSDGSLDSGEVNPGATFTRIFNEPMTLTYVCKLHPQLMTGSLVVEGAPVVPPDTERTIEIVEPSNQSSSWGFDPEDAQVVTGTTITWRNTGSTQHTVTADNGSFDSGMLAPGETFVRTFDDPIALTYKCTPHPWMTATISVGAPGEDPPVAPKPKPKPSVKNKPKPPAVVDSADRDSDEPMTFDAQIVEGSISDPASWGFAPESLTVREGDTVTWTNTGSVQHTVTARTLTFDSGMLDPGEDFSVTFAAVDTISFACVPHPWMTGAIRVVAAGSSATDLPPPPDAPEHISPPIGGGSTTEPIGTGDAGAVATPGAGVAIGTDAWSQGHVPLAAATSAALLTIGFLFVLPLAHELRKQATQRSADEIVEPIETSEPVEPDAIASVVVADLPPVKRKAASAPKRKEPATRKPAARKPGARKPVARGAASERIVLDEAPKRTRARTELASAGRKR